MSLKTFKFKFIFSLYKLVFLIFTRNLLVYLIKIEKKSVSLTLGYKLKSYHFNYV